MSVEQRQACLETARQRLVNAIQAIDQVSNRELPADLIRAGAALAEANLHAADTALRLMEAS